MRLIDADVAINELNENQIEGDASYKGLGKAKSIIMELMRHPVVNNRGKDAVWIKDKVFMKEGGEIYNYRCSACSGYALMLLDSSGTHTVLSKFCPTCGAKMRVED